MGTFHLDTLEWVRLQCAACGQSAEILQLDLEADGQDQISSPCCGALLVTADDSTPDEPASEEPPEAETALGSSEIPAAEARRDEADSQPETLPTLDVSLAGDEPEERDVVWRNRRRHSASVVVSVVVHGVVLLLLAAIVLHLPQRLATDVLNASFDDATDRLVADAASRAENETLAETVDLSLPSEQASELPQPPSAAAPFPERTELTPAPSPLSTDDDLQPSTSGTSDRAAVQITGNSAAGSDLQSGNTDGSSKSADSTRPKNGWSIPLGDGFSGRRADVRRQLAALTGATPASEAAVQAGLKWLAAHQREDGSWSLQHTHVKCKDACLPDSSMDCPTAATGLALLCFLGAGHSHTDGEYQEIVQRGIDWLLAQSRDGDLRTSLDHVAPEGGSAMYAHGFAAMALCEAYGMTLDRTLTQPCEEAIEFIAESQDPVGGGWRYSPGDPGDTSVVGWQVMALVSARMSGLKVPDKVREGVVRFLQSVHLPSTGEFGYTGKGRGTVATTAIGSLCSLYLHSSLDRVSLQRVSQILGTQDPKSNNEYANYYVSLVLHHIGGEHWRVWNAACRDSIVASQVRYGHAAGSWDPISKWGRSGGRLYSTCMSVLTLEVYYRHLPLYADDAFEIGLTAKPISKKRTTKPKSNATAKTSGKLSEDAPARFVPVSTDEPVAVPGSAGVTEIAQQPLTVSPTSQPKSVFPRATRFSPPLRNLFEEAALRSVTDGAGREWRLYPNAGFGMPLLKVGDQSLVQTGGNFGWFQAGKPIFATAAGIVRYSGGSVTGSGLNDKPGEGPGRDAAAGWGNTVVIEHALPEGASLTTVYAHLGDDRRVEAGDVVAAGELIGSIGVQSEFVNGGCTPHLFFAIHPGSLAQDSVQLAAFAADVKSWLNPVDFLREQQADVLPAFFFSPTWNPFPRPAVSPVGKPARDWPGMEWLRKSRHGRSIPAMRGKTVCLVCVQSSCEASRLLGGLLLSDLAKRYQSEPDVALILLHTPTENSRENSVAVLRNSIGAFPEHVAIGHVSAKNGPPLVLDWYGIRATPWTILISPDGTIAENGVLTDAAEVGRLIDALRE